MEVIEGEITDLSEHESHTSWDTDEVPYCIRRVLDRSARLQRLVKLDAPDIILEHERRMVAEAVLEVSEWVLVNVTTPAKQKIEKRADTKLLAELTEHIKTRHSHDYSVANPPLDLGYMARLHNGWHQLPVSEVDHEVDDWSSPS